MKFYYYFGGTSPSYPCSPVKRLNTYLVNKTSLLCMLGYFACFFVICAFSFFFILTLSKKSFRNTIRVSNRQNVGSDLGPNYLQRLSADDKSPLAGKGIIQGGRRHRTCWGKSHRSHNQNVVIK